MIRLIAAKSLNNVIGVDGELPWILPVDLKRFKEITTDQKHKNIIVMGRKTWESIGERPLPNRINVVISRQPRNLPRKTEFSNVVWLNDCSQVLKIFDKDKDVINIIGGESVYRYFMPLADEMYITNVYVDIPILKGKTYAMFPHIYRENWIEVEYGNTCYHNDITYQLDHYSRQNFST